MGGARAISVRRDTPTTASVVLQVQQRPEEARAVHGPGRRLQDRLWPRHHVRPVAPLIRLWRRDGRGRGGRRIVGIARARAATGVAAGVRMEGRKEGGGSLAGQASETVSGSVCVRL